MMNIKLVVVKKHENTENNYWSQKNVFSQLDKG